MNIPCRWIISSAILAAGLFAGSRAEAASPPNIVYILADVSCYNPESKIPTPHVDRLAREGTRFTDAHTPSAVCTPTRYGILTGRYNWRSPTTKKLAASAYVVSSICWKRRPIERPIVWSENRLDW